MNIDFSIKDTIRKDGINIANLAKLGEYVQDHVTDRMFSMALFLLTYNDLEKELHECVTLGCLLGYSPKALNVEFEKPFTTALDNYAYFSHKHYNIACDEQVYKFLFSVLWSDVDNSIQGALQRIKFVIDHDDYDYGETNYNAWYRLVLQHIPLFN